MRFFKLPFLVLVSVVVSICFGCKQGKTIYEKEKVFIDSIKISLNTMEIALESINASELENRVALINTWYVHLKDTAYDVAKKQQVDYNGFKVIYKKYIDNFFAYQSEIEVLKTKLNDLEVEVNNQKLDKKAFKKKYFVLKQETETLGKKIFAITQPINDLAFSWRRYYKQNKYLN